jgi:hypothetical protein
MTDDVLKVLQFIHQSASISWNLFWVSANINMTIFNIYDVLFFGNECTYGFYSFNLTIKIQIFNKIFKSLINYLFFIISFLLSFILKFLLTWLYKFK